MRLPRHAGTSLIVGISCCNQEQVVAKHSIDILVNIWRYAVALLFSTQPIIFVGWHKYLPSKLEVLVLLSAQIIPTINRSSLSTPKLQESYSRGAVDECCTNQLAWEDVRKLSISLTQHSSCILTVAAIYVSRNGVTSDCWKCTYQYCMYFLRCKSERKCIPNLLNRFTLKIANKYNRIIFHCQYIID